MSESKKNPKTYRDSLKVSKKNPRIANLSRALNEMGKKNNNNSVQEIYTDQIAYDESPNR